MHADIIQENNLTW